MRRIGTLTDEQEARAFADYLFTLQIDTQVDRRDGEWDVWVLDEDRLEQARRELAEFRTDPEAEKYARAARAAQQRREDEWQQVVAATRRHINLRERWERPIYRQVPVTLLLIGLSIAATLLTRFGRNEEWMALLQVQSRFPAPFLADVRSGEVWRLLTPVFVHLSMWHILGNGWMTYLLGGAIERSRGSWKLLWQVLLIAVLSNVAQYALGGARYFGGMSGVVYGLFGYVWIRGRFDPTADLAVSREATVLMLGWLLLCTTGLVGPIANVAHFSGLGVGVLLAAWDLLRRQLREMR